MGPKHTKKLNEILSEQDKIKKELVQKGVIPNDFYCPIGLELMTDPVLLSNGKCYERYHIENWLKDQSTCPTTRDLVLKELVPQKLLKMHLQTTYPKEYKEAAESLKEEQLEDKRDENRKGRERQMSESIDQIQRSRARVNSVQKPARPSLSRQSSELSLTDSSEDSDEALYERAADK